MKIYTRSGDKGETSLFGGQRVSKAHVRVRAYGAVDELNAVVGMASAALNDAAFRDTVLDDTEFQDTELNETNLRGTDLNEALARVQSRLFDVGADLATPSDSPASSHIQRTRPEWIVELEDEIDAMEVQLSPLRTFILPGGSSGAAALHLARTVCRRAERRVIIAQQDGEDISMSALMFLNRLSDWLFVAARFANLQSGVEDVPWHPDRSASDC